MPRIALVCITLRKDLVQIQRDMVNQGPRVRLEGTGFFPGILSVLRETSSQPIYHSISDTWSRFALLLDST